MRQAVHGLLILAATLLPAAAQRGVEPFIGCWDIYITTDNGSSYPDWMEVFNEGGVLTARVQPRGGSVHPVANLKMEGSHLVVTVQAATARGPETVWDLTTDGKKLSGTQKRGEKTDKIAGVRAPALTRSAPKEWTAPESLFNGKDLSGWTPTDHPENNHWAAQDGVLVNISKGANLRTTRKFDDFKLHIEFNCPENGNSGIYLRGRYEVQVEYEPAGTEDGFHSMGAIYGMIAPSTELPRKPGQWETFDITLVGRDVTIVRNGVTTISHRDIAGITGGALDADEGEPGPFYLQGDHTGGMKYRNITVSVPKK